MENDPREIELDFNSSAEKENVCNSENINGFSDGNAGAVVGQWPEMSSDGVENIVSLQEKTVEIAEETATAAKNIVADMPRSWQPMNRPAGTPPLTGNPVREKVSAVELTISGKSYGIALRILREHHQVSFKELEQATLIQKHYLEALENENLAALPPLAYVIAFIRSLCSFYKLSKETGDQMVAKLKEQLEYTCNEEMINSLDVDDSGAEINERRIKRIVFGFSGGLLLLVVLAVCGFFLFKESGQPKVTVVENPDGKVQHFDPNTIYPLLEPPTLDLPKLPVAE